MKTLEQAEDDARRINPALDNALSRVEEEKVRYLEPVVEYFGHLEEEIAEMQIASRFRRDKKPDFRGIVGTNPMLTDLNEAEYKRAQLKSDLDRVRGKAMILIGEVETLVMDMEATKIEDQIDSIKDSS
ncbi:MAG: hypothetical protein AAB675_04465 [Patescibacteria group bacterium]